VLLSNDGARYTAIIYKLGFFIYSIVFRIFDLSRLNSFGFVFILPEASPLAPDHNNHLI